MVHGEGGPAVPAAAAIIVIANTVIGIAIIHTPGYIATLFSGNSKVCHFCFLFNLFEIRFFWLGADGTLHASAATVPACHPL